jgi:resuscitation-promoting factor RpfA
MAKSREAFRTISEVSDWLGAPAHVLRFWESRFNQIKPVKRAGGRRYYRPNDMALLGGIKRLLHDDGITIKGVQKILREKGVKYVSSLSLDEIGVVPDQVDEKSTASMTEETPIEAILDESTDVQEQVAEPEAQLMSATAEITTDQEVEIREKIASIFAVPESEIEVEVETTEIPDDAPTLDETHEQVSPVLEVAAQVDTAPTPIATPNAETSSDSDIHEDRITALYHRLTALRDRLQVEMQAG